MSDLMQRLAGLSAAERAALQRKLLEKRGGGGAQRIGRRAGAGPWPLSYAQELMWLIDRLTPGTSAYNVPRMTRIKGPLDLDALRRALDEIVARHEVLRTTYDLVDGRPVQVIAPRRSVDLRVLDLRHLPPAERQVQAECLLADEADRSFDLVRDLLMRAALIRLADDECILSLVSHHIASDGVSKGILYRELEAAYDAFRQGRPSPLSPPALQYADYAVWQRGWLTGAVLQGHLDYWKRQLAEAPALLELPTDRPRSAVQSGRGRRLRTLFPSELGAALEQIGRRGKCTLFMTALAAFQALLHRYTGQQRIVVGTPVSARDRSEIEGVIGYFANSLVLHTDLSGDPTFVELLGRVREVALGAYAHQDLPFEKLLVELKPKRDLSYSPLYQVMFAVGNVMMGDELALPGLECSRVWPPRATSKFDMSWGMRAVGDGVAVGVEYNPDLFDDDTVGRMIGHFRTLLEGVAADPTRRVSQLPLLTERERRRILVEWNSTAAAYPCDRCVHELFEAQAEATPDAVAVVCGPQQLTYRVLNARANRLARHLQALGVAPGTRVGLCLEPSPELPVAVLAILKAGGAYVPLDPWYPRDRLRLMLENAGISVLLTQECLATNLPAGEYRAVCLDADWPAVARHSEAPLACGVTPDHLLYVIYTSGSTGVPKGAGVYHRGFVNLLHWFTTEFRLAPADRTLLVSSLSFDLTQKNLFAPLITGGQLHLMTSPHYDARAVVRAIAAGRISLLNCAPSAFYPLVSDPADFAALASLRCLFLGGEPIATALLAPWVHSPHCHCEIANTYGPTECTDICAAYRLRDEDYSPRAVVPVGRPIPNARVLVLDDHLELVPVGVPGELCVLGEGVGAGYLRDPALTARKFVADPYSRQPGGRLYRTGDLVRYRPDGNIEFLGRIDHQVKVRGYRIELGEVEAALAQHPSVREAVVVARDAPGGDKRLVAYLVPAATQARGAGEGALPLVAAGLRLYLKERLPGYMVPSAFVVLPALPVTPSGKVDRRALPAPEEAAAGAEPSRVAPRNATEERLVGLWEEVLGTRPIGVTDDFFELGGHSLLATRVLAAVRAALGVELALRELFEAPTVADLAARLRQEGSTLACSALVPVRSAGSRPPLFCVHAGDGDIFFFRPLAKELGPDQPFYGLHPLTFQGKQGPFASVGAMAAHYVREIRTVQPEGPYRLAGYCTGGLVAYEMARQLWSQGQRVALLALVDTPCQRGSNRGYFHYSRRLLHHLNVFARHNWKDKWSFVLEKASVVKGVFVRWFQRMAFKLYQWIRTPLPPGIRNVPTLTRLVIGSYNLQPYPGKVTLFIAQDLRKHPAAEKHFAAWEQWAAGGVEVHWIPGKHLEIVRPPHIRHLAGRLQDCLDKAPTGQSGQEEGPYAKPLRERGR
jgi:aspartate racemase